MDISQANLRKQFDNAHAATAKDGKGQSVHQAFVDAGNYFSSIAGFPKYILEAVASRETGIDLRYCKTPNLHHADGHGVGIFGLDDRYHDQAKQPGFFLDVRQQIVAAAMVLLDTYKQCQGWFETLNAYNGGVVGTNFGNDTSKTASSNSRGIGDYGPDTLERAYMLLNWYK
jgi:hypothetical protein